MASSVSSERTFSAAGITISKRHNRLKEDIVEALQCLKCLYHEDLIFREVTTSADMEAEMDLIKDVLSSAYGDSEVDEDASNSWDSIMVDLDNDIQVVN